MDSKQIGELLARMRKERGMTQNRETVKKLFYEQKRRSKAGFAPARCDYF